MSVKRRRERGASVELVIERLSRSRESFFWISADIWEGVEGRMVEERSEVLELEWNFVPLMYFVRLSYLF